MIFTGHGVDIPPPKEKRNNEVDEISLEDLEAAGEVYDKLQRDWWKVKIGVVLDFEGGQDRGRWKSWEVYLPAEGGYVRRACEKARILVSDRFMKLYSPQAVLHTWLLDIVRTSKKE